MATFHMTKKSGRKGSAATHSAYITRHGKYGKGEKPQDLVANSHGNLPEWADDDPHQFWRMADKYERANGAAYREFELALPRELSSSEQLNLLDEFIQTEIGDKPYQYAIHSPTAALGGNAQPHAHIMVSDRKPDGIARPPEQHFKRFNGNCPEAGGCRKDSGGKDRRDLKEALVATREKWADLQNRHLERNGHTARVDHRSNRDRGLSQNVERHLGHIAISKMSAEEKAIYQTERQNRRAVK